MTTDKRREKGVESRRIIIEAAIKCIASRGLCDTTLDRVADIAKVSRALVVFHFKSKKGMLSTVLEEIGSQYNRQWQMIMDIEGLSAQQRLLKLISYDVNLPIQNPELIAVWHTFWGEAKGLYNELSSTRDEKYAQDLAQLIKEIAEQGNYVDVRPDLVCSALVAMLFGLWWEAHLNPSDHHYDRSMRVVECFLSANFPEHFKIHNG